MSGKTIWFTGLSGSGKSTLSNALKEILSEKGHPAVLLDGDVLRKGLNRDLGFTASDRAENIRRAGEVAKLLNDIGHIVLAAFITPLESIRKAVRSLFDSDKFVEIYLECPLTVCESRDPKGLYALARRGLVKEFTGVSAPFQDPESPDFCVDTDRNDLGQAINLVLKFLELRFPEIGKLYTPRSPKKHQTRKVAVIGLDCAPPRIVFDESNGLNNIRSLMKSGVWGTLRSTDPPITIPAWTTITTGRDPGELGLYGFRNRLTREDYAMVTVNSSNVACPRVWDQIENHGKRSILVGIPQTFPAAPHYGLTISGFPALENSPDFSYPRGLINDLACMASESYLADVKDFRSIPKKQLEDSLYSMVDTRFHVVRELLRKEPWDFFMMVEIATDRLQHAFWDTYENIEPGGQNQARHKNVIPDFYRYLDMKIGEILKTMDDETTVFIVSDHGAKSSSGGICVNEWLMRKGLLTLKQKPVTETSLSVDDIDWDRTYVWSEGGYYARIFMNVKGREPKGIIEPSDYESFRNKLKDQLVLMRDLGDEVISNLVLKPEDLYREVNGIAPDLIVYFDGLSKRSLGNVGVKDIVVKGQKDGLDACNHHHDGIFVASRLSDMRHGVKLDMRLNEASCCDITPTILAEFGIEIPEGLVGRVLPIGGEYLVSKGSPSTEGATGLVNDYDQEGRGFTPEEEAIVKKRLSDLGYI